MATQRKGGTIQLAIDGEVLLAKGAFTYSLGGPMRSEAIVGTDGVVHGYTETHTVPFIEGTITDEPGLDLERVRTLENVLVTLTLANGKTIALFEAWQASEAQVNTEQGEISVRFDGTRAKELPA